MDLIERVADKEVIEGFNKEKIVVSKIKLVNKKEIVRSN